MVVLLNDRFIDFARRCVAAVEESVYDSACVKQVPDGAKSGVLFLRSKQTRFGGIEVGPLERYE